MIVTDMQEVKRNKQRMSVFLDGEFAFAAYIEILVGEDVRVGAELTEEDVARIRKQSDERYAWERAVRYLSHGAKSEKRVREYLLGKDISAGLVDQTIFRLREYRLVDDRELGRQLAQRLYQQYGRYTVVAKMREKGIPQDIIDQVTQSTGDEEVLMRQVERLFERHSREEDPYKRRQKIKRTLAARGFSFDDIQRAIQEYEKIEAALRAPVE